MLNLTKSLLEKKSNSYPNSPEAVFPLHVADVGGCRLGGFCSPFSFSKSVSARGGLYLFFECWVWAVERLHGTPW